MPSHKRGARGDKEKEKEKEKEREKERDGDRNGKSGGRWAAPSASFIRGRSNTATDNTRYYCYRNIYLCRIIRSPNS